MVRTYSLAVCHHLNLVLGLKDLGVRLTWSYLLRKICRVPIRRPRSRAEYSRDGSQKFVGIASRLGNFQHLSRADRRLVIRGLGLQQIVACAYRDLLSRWTSCHSEV